MDYKSRYHVIITCQGFLWYLQRTLLIFSKLDIHFESLGFETFCYKPRMKISVITNISVLRFYGYIRNIEKISVDFFSQILVDFFSQISVDIFSQILVERKLFKIYKNACKNSKK